ncbi:hypothetical protein [Kitasatospora griseola]|uniref:hypothetical protein n=1 Tax=Kitasatospora griseola TaxID=2064 RepID=UPI00342BBAFD
MEQLPDSVDLDIFERRIVAALVTIRQVRGCNLHGALDVFTERYEVLRREQPDRFRLTREEYSEGVYT